MTRPLRLEFPGALYHVTSRGDQREAIYRDDTDRRAWLDILASVCDRFNFTVYGFCQMTNHYHVILETVDGNLSQGMRQLNAVYSQHVNRHHGLSGHVFQGRYHAVLVQKESYLLELTRYVVLNPLRAHAVVSLDQWAWNSHHFMVGSKPVPPWLDADWTLGHFGSNRGDAIHAYQAFVLAGMNGASPLDKVRHQLLLGDDEFVTRHRNGLPERLREIPKAQRRALALPLASYLNIYPDKWEAMARAYFSTAYSMSQIAEHFKVSYRTVSRAVSRFRN